MKRFMLALAALLAGSTAAWAQDEVQEFNAFAFVEGKVTAVRSGDKAARTAGRFDGPFFIETDEGPLHVGTVTCTGASEVELGTTRQTASGGCTFSSTGATAWGDWSCEGYNLVGCRGKFRLTGGTARLEGASGEATLVWRPSAYDLKKEVDAASTQTIVGVVMWRDFKLSRAKK